MDLQRRLHLGRVFGGRVVPVIGHGRGQLGHLGRQHVGNATAVAEPHRAHATGAVGATHERFGRGQHVLPGLALIKGGEQGAGLVFIARVATQGRQCIGRHGQVAVQRDAARDVFDVRVQAAVFVDHQHAGQLARCASRFGHIGLQAAVARRRRHVDHLGGETWVVFGDDLCGGKVGAERGQQAGRRHATHGELGGAVEKTPPVQVAVHIGVKQDEQFLVEISSGEAGHGVSFATGGRSSLPACRKAQSSASCRGFGVESLGGARFRCGTDLTL